MKKIKLLRWSFLIISLLPYLSGCQKESVKQVTVPQIETVAREIIDLSGTCTLITIDSLGQPRARIMDPFSPEEDFVIWFGTNVLSRKVMEITENTRTTVNFYAKEAAAYVSLYGEAEIVIEESFKRQYWKPQWQSFYPNYPEGYCLIRFTPSYLELISEKHGITGDSITWKPAIIEF